MRALLSTIPDRQVRRSLAASTVDAGLWALMFGLAEYFILPFAIHFGAGTVETGLVSGMGQLGVAAAQLAGAWLVARLRRRKALALATTTVHALSWLAVLAGAALTGDPLVIVIGYAAGLFATSLAGPGWLSWMNDLVPESMRGAFWGKRNAVAGLAQFAAIGAAGLGFRWAEPRGLTFEAFALYFSLATVFRLAGVYAISRQHEPPMPEGLERGRTGLGEFFRSLPKGKLGRFVAYGALTTFAVNLLPPVLSVHLLKSVGLSYGEYTAVMMASMVLSFVAMSYWGPLTDRFGNYRILVLCGGALPVMGFGWALARTVPAMLALQVFSGFVWAGFNLATTNFIFDSVHRSRVAPSMAGWNAINNLAAFAGSLSGGAVAALAGKLDLPFLLPGNYALVFALSGLIRLVVFVAFIGRFREVREVEASPPAIHFFVYQPLTLLLTRFQVIAEAARGERRGERRGTRGRGRRASRKDGDGVE